MHTIGFTSALMSRIYRPKHRVEKGLQEEGIRPCPEYYVAAKTLLLITSLRGPPSQRDIVDTGSK